MDFLCYFLPCFFPHPPIAGERSPKSPLQSDLDAFHSGFQTCTKEVLQYLSRFESWTPREQRCAQLISHLHTVCTRFLPSPPLLAPRVCGGKGPGPTYCAPGVQQDHAGPKLEGQPHCVPVIQRTQKGGGGGSNNRSSSHHGLQLTHSSLELGGENDTDTDSGYGGESEGRPDGEKSQGGVMIKQEPSGDEGPPLAKRLKLDCSNSSPPAVLSPDQAAAAALVRPDPALLSSLLALGGLGGGGGGGVGSPFGQQPAAPFCLPFYFISPSAAAAYMQPFLDKSNLEKFLYPATAAAAAPIPLLYPGIPAQAAAATSAAAAAAAAFPCLSSVLALGEKAGSGSGSASALLPPDVASLPQHLPHPFPCNPAGLEVDADLLSQEQPLQSAQESP